VGCIDPVGLKNVGADPGRDGDGHEEDLHVFANAGVTRRRCDPTDGIVNFGANLEAGFGIAGPHSRFEFAKQGLQGSKIFLLQDIAPVVDDPFESVTIMLRLFEISRSEKKHGGRDILSTGAAWQVFGWVLSCSCSAGWDRVNSGA
jgi:hypothetical protein